MKRATVLTFLFLLYAVGSNCLDAQTCSFKPVVLSDENGNDVAKVSMVLTNIDTKVVYKSLLKSGMPYFAVLPEGNYETLLKGQGYKTAKFIFSFDCKFHQELFWLHEGRVDEIVDIHGDAYKDSRQNKITPPVENWNDWIKEQEIYQVGLGCRPSRLATPYYPYQAKKNKIAGTVQVRIIADENGEVIFAQADRGATELYQASEMAARASKFTPTKIGGKAVKITGIIVYNFVAQ
ncbi:MAG: energy transducer TonB [Pyrinomonadaceae bacterium]